MNANRYRMLVAEIARRIVSGEITEERAQQINDVDGWLMDTEEEGVTMRSMVSVTWADVVEAIDLDRRISAAFDAMMKADAKQPKSNSPWFRG